MNGGHFVRLSAAKMLDLRVSLLWPFAAHPPRTPCSEIAVEDAPEGDGKTNGIQVPQEGLEHDGQAKSPDMVRCNPKRRTDNPGPYCSDCCSYPRGTRTTQW